MSRIITRAPVCMFVCLATCWTANGPAQQLPVPNQPSVDASVDPRLVPHCKQPTYDPYKPPPVDAVREAFDRKKYRLVIGVGKNKYDSSFDREYVDNTAALVDGKLQKLGYLPLPSLRNASQPYLSGTGATKKAIMDALVEMQSELGQGDIGVIYYVGHGGITPSDRDISLSVYDRPVANDEGIRFDDLVGTLELNRTRSTITDIPNYFIILDACVSGNAARPNVQILENDGGIQHIEEIEGRIVPAQFAILSSTATGRDAEAYDLKGTSVSAFGFFFARAIDEDWDCVDEPQPDGILTLNEIQQYLRTQLKLAFALKATPKEMEPTILDKDRTAFIAYNAERRSINGLRNQIKAVRVQSKDPALAAEVEFSTGAKLRCAQPEGCSFLVSEKLLKASTAELRQTDMSPADVLNQLHYWSLTLADNGLFNSTLMFNRASPDRSAYIENLARASLRQTPRIDSQLPSGSTPPHISVGLLDEHQASITPIEGRIDYFVSLGDNGSAPKTTLTESQWKENGGQGLYASYLDALKGVGTVTKTAVANLYPGQTDPAMSSMAFPSAEQAAGSSPDKLDSPRKIITKGEVTSGDLKDLLEGKRVDAGGVTLIIK